MLEHSLKINIGGTSGPASISLFAPYELEYEYMGNFFRGLVDRTDYFLASCPIMAFNLDGSIRWSRIMSPYDEGILDLKVPAIGETHVTGAFWSDSLQKTVIARVNHSTGATYFQQTDLTNGYDTAFYTPDNKILLTGSSKTSYVELSWDGSRYDVGTVKTFFPEYSNPSVHFYINWKFVPGENSMYYKKGNKFVKWNTSSLTKAWSYASNNLNGEPGDVFGVRANGNPLFLRDGTDGDVLRLVELNKDTGAVVRESDIELPFTTVGAVDNLIMTPVDDILYVRFGNGYYVSIDTETMEIVHSVSADWPNSDLTYYNASFVTRNGVWWGYADMENPYNGTNVVGLFSYNGKKLKKYYISIYTSMGDRTPLSQSSLMPANNKIYIPTGDSIIELDPYGEEQVYVM